MELQINGKIFKDYKTHICGDGHIHLDFGDIAMTMDCEFAEYFALNVKRAALAVNSEAHLRDNDVADPENVIRPDFSPSKYEPIK